MLFCSIQFRFVIRVGCPGLSLLPSGGGPIDRCNILHGRLRDRKVHIKRIQRPCSLSIWKSRFLRLIPNRATYPKLHSADDGHSSQLRVSSRLLGYPSETGISLTVSSIAISGGESKVLWIRQ